MSDRFKRVEPVDLLTSDEGALLLYERELIQLGLMGAAVFQQTEQPLTVEEIADALVATFGEAPDGTTRESTQSIIDTLLAKGVLCRVDVAEGNAGD